MRESNKDFHIQNSLILTSLPFRFDSHNKLIQQLVTFPQNKVMSDILVDLIQFLSLVLVFVQRVLQFCYLVLPVSSFSVSFSPVLSLSVCLL